MKKPALVAVHIGAAFLLGLLLFVAAVMLPISPIAAEQQEQQPATPQAESTGFPNFDIRENTASETLTQLRSSAGRDASFVDGVERSLVRGEEGLRSRLPGVVVEYNTNLGHPEVISPDVWKDTPGSLTRSANGSRPETLRAFLKENQELFGATDAQIDELRQHADYTNPDGNLSFVHFDQYINDIPVFAGEVKAAFDREGQIVRVINNIAPGLGYGPVSKDFGAAENAVLAAGKNIERQFAGKDLKLNAKQSTDLKAVFGDGDWATTAEKMYFPTEPGVAVPAWRVLIWGPVDSYYVIVDTSGTMLWRKNITEHQSQTSTFNVYANSNAFMNVADSPAPLSPGPSNNNGAQGSIIARQNVTLVGNEGADFFNNNGWVTDGTNVTDGNNTEAGVDRLDPNGVDATIVGSPNRVFSSTWNPPPGNPAPGDEPLTAQAQRGAVIQMFYVVNRYHDELYKRGFNEGARNFQHNNFSRGGLGNDRVSSEGQDNTLSSACPIRPCVNNANFSTPSDGGRGRMQMYVWNGPTPDYDGTTDAEIIIHELTHGTSNRLHGNASGLSTNMSRGMGEGWGDWYALTLLAEPTDPLDGVYALGGYATYLATSGYTQNYYYGIRRFPKSIISSLGANGKPHNPLTFRHLNSNCNTGINTIGAFPRGPFGSSTCDQVHNAGEIWSSALWEVRALMIQRLGFTAGTERVLQVVTDGMKLAPTGPTFLQERDAIIAAAQSFSAEDAADVREGFRRRGMGFSASIQSTSPASVTESFDAWPGGPTPTPTPTPTATPTPTPTPTPVPTATVSGTITRNTNGKGVGGVTVTLQGPSGTQTTTTSGNGSYSFTGVATGATYTITPSANRWTFTPTSRSVLVNGSVTGQNFVGSR